jgi:hypothetical protein
VRSKREHDRFQHNGHDPTVLGFVDPVTKRSNAAHFEI